VGLQQLREKNIMELLWEVPENIAALKALTRFRLALIKKPKLNLRSPEIPTNS
jgi:hypothetical protein